MRRALPARASTFFLRACYRILNGRLACNSRNVGRDELAGLGPIGLDLVREDRPYEGGCRIGEERSSGWRFIVGLILIAFTLQSYITQTHIHNAAPAAITKIVNHSHGKAPADDNPMDCPFCQAVAHDGPFFLPAIPLLILSIEFVDMPHLPCAFIALGKRRAYLAEQGASSTLIGIFPSP